MGATSSDSGSSMPPPPPPPPLGLGLTLGIGLGIGLGADMDPGYCTQFDSHSNSSSDVVSHPPHPSQTTESPPVAPRTRVPLYPHGTKGHFPRELPPRARRPPDYNVAAQMARMARLSRAHSHEGVASYYNNSDPEEENKNEKKNLKKMIFEAKEISKQSCCFLSSYIF